MAIAPKNPKAISAILIKPIRDVEGKVVGLGELVNGDVAVVPGPLEFQDGTQQNTAYVPGSGNVTSFVGREGAITPAYGDYSALQVSLDPTTIGGGALTATNVQQGFEQVGTAINSIKSGSKFSGTLGFNDADPAKPAAGAVIAPYYIFNTAGKRTVGDASGVDVKVGDWLAYNLDNGKWTHLAYSAVTQTAKGTSYDPGTHRVIKATDVQGALDQTDTALEILESQVAGINGRNYVNAFAGRSGVVTPADGDYDAVQITNMPAGPIVKAVQVQGALNELESAIVQLQASAGSSAALDAHINATADAHVATAITYAPVEGVKSTNVQAAIQEVANKALPFFDTNGVSKPIKFI
jgi:hypothetical protein